MHGSSAAPAEQAETTDCRIRITKDVPVLRIDHPSIKGMLLGVWQISNGRKCDPDSREIERGLSDCHDGQRGFGRQKSEAFVTKSQSGEGCRAPSRSYTMFLAVKYRGGPMGNLSSALQQLRAERKQAQARVESIDQAISVIESLNGLGTSRQVNQPTGTVAAPKRFISKASRLKMARAQRARWARAKKESQPVLVAAAKTTTAPVKRTMSAAARRKIAAFQRARWAKLKSQQKKAA
jgi:hypothetical protein